MCAQFTKPSFLTSGSSTLNMSPATHSTGTAAAAAGASASSDDGAFRDASSARPCSMAVGTKSMARARWPV